MIAQAGSDSPPQELHLVRTCGYVGSGLVRGVLGCGRWEKAWYKKFFVTETHGL